MDQHKPSTNIGSNDEQQLNSNRDTALERKAGEGTREMGRVLD